MGLMGNSSKKKDNREECSWEKDEEILRCHIGKEEEDGSEDRSAKVEVEVDSQGKAEVTRDSFKGDYTEQEKKEIRQQKREQAKSKARRNRGGKAFEA